jgi:hypothetical protein
VSRSHAEIVFRMGDFFIKDLESSTGSFLKVQDWVPVVENMIFELGSNQFRVSKIKVIRVSSWIMVRKWCSISMTVPRKGTLTSNSL